MKAAKYATGESTKLQTRYKGPYVITEVWPSDTYKIQYLAAKGESKRPTTAHVSQLKIWRGRPNDSDNDDESENDVDENVIVKDATIRRTTRMRQKPVKFRDYVN